MNHGFIGVVSGRHDPDDRTLFCFKVFCECGWVEVADSYDDADAKRKKHREFRAKPVHKPKRNRRLVY